MTRYRLGLWLCTCVLALLPLVLRLLLLADVHTNPSSADVSPELLFFAQAIGILVLSDLHRVGAGTHARVGYVSLYCGSTVVIAISAALYGAFLLNHMDSRALQKLFPLSVAAALIAFGLGTCAQAFIHDQRTQSAL